MQTSCLTLSRKTNREYYAEIDPDNWGLRYKYKTFQKGRDRHMFNRTPRRIKYVVGNKFILEEIRLTLITCTMQGSCSLLRT